MYELTKREKRICRELIDQSVEKEFETGLERADEIMNEWKSKTLSGRLAFHKLRDHLNDFRKHLARRYDSLRGSDYLRVVAEIVYDGYLTDNDTEELSDAAKTEIRTWQSLWDGDI